MSEQSQSQQITRRQALRYGGIAVGAASTLAGCSVLNSNSGSFKSVEIKPGSITATLTEGADVDTVRLRLPGAGR